MLVGFYSSAREFSISWVCHLLNVCVVCFVCLFQMCFLFCVFSTDQTRQSVFWSVQCFQTLRFFKLLLVFSFCGVSQSCQICHVVFRFGWSPLELLQVMSARWMISACACWIYPLTSCGLELKSTIGANGLLKPSVNRRTACHRVS